MIDVEFCPNCKMRLAPQEKDSSNIILSCSNCGYTDQSVSNVSIPARIVEHGAQELIAIIGKKEQKLRILPTSRQECPKCGNNRAYVWQVQTRGSDESSTQFFRCTKCNYTFREYG